MSPHPAIDISSTASPVHKKSPPKLSVLSYNVSFPSGAAMPSKGGGKGKPTSGEDSDARAGTSKGAGKGKPIDAPQVPKSVQRRNPKTSDYSRKDEDQYADDSKEEDEKGGKKAPTGRGKQGRSGSIGGARGRGRGKLPRPGESTTVAQMSSLAPQTPKGKASTLSTLSPQTPQQKASTISNAGTLAPQTPQQKASTISTAGTLAPQTPQQKASTISTAGTLAPQTPQQKASTISTRCPSKLRTEIDELEELSKTNQLPKFASSTAPASNRYPLSGISENETTVEEDVGQFLMASVFRPAVTQEILLNIPDVIVEEPGTSRPTTQPALSRGAKIRAWFHQKCCCCCQPKTASNPSAKGACPCHQNSATIGGCTGTNCCGQNGACCQPKTPPMGTSDDSV